MKKINKKSMNLGFKILAILAFSLLIIPASAFADYSYSFLYGNGSSYNGGSGYNSGGSYYGGNNYYNSAYGNSYYQAPYQAPIYTPPPAVTPVVYSNETNHVVASRTTAPKTVAKTNTVSSASVANSDTVSGLTANTIYGSNSFLPSGLVQWVLFAIFVLVIVILSRLLFGYREKYLSTPLKHE